MGTKMASRGERLKIFNIQHNDLAVDQVDDSHKHEWNKSLQLNSIFARQKAVMVSFDLNFVIIHFVWVLRL